MERDIAENQARDLKIDVTQVVREFWESKSIEQDVWQNKLEKIKREMSGRIKRWYDY